jgi:cardiolipin synthase
MKENWLFLNLANLITTARLIFSAWLVVLALSGEDLILMFALVILCGITDATDGWVARRYHIESKIGGFLDRLADKIFICPTMIILIYRFWPSVDIGPIVRSLTATLIVVIVFLEIFLITSGIFGLVKGINISSNEWGRRKMVFQSAAVFLWFLTLVIENYLRIKVFYFLIFLIDTVLVIAIGLTIKSIEGYYRRWLNKN